MQRISLSRSTPFQMPCSKYLRRKRWSEGLSVVRCEDLRHQAPCGICLPSGTRPCNHSANESQWSLKKQKLLIHSIEIELRAFILKLSRFKVCTALLRDIVLHTRSWIALASKRGRTLQFFVHSLIRVRIPTAWCRCHLSQAYARAN